MATYKEYISRKCKPFGLTDDDVNDIIEEANLVGSDKCVYSQANLALWSHFDDILKYVVSNRSEGNLSESWNIDGIKLFYNQLCVKLGKPNQLSSTPRIKNRSNVW